MPITIGTVRLPFVDDMDQPIQGAWYTIREKLSHIGMGEYLEAATNADIEKLAANLADEDDEDKASKTAARLEAIRLQRQFAAILLRHGLVRLEGVTDIDGKDISLEEFGEQDGRYVGQVVRAIQNRNQLGVAPDPNSGAPSASS